MPVESGEYGACRTCGYPNMDVLYMFILENQKKKRMIWGYPHFWTPPYGHVPTRMMGGIGIDNIEWETMGISLDVVGTQVRIRMPALEQQQCGSMRVYPEKK